MSRALPHEVAQVLAMVPAWFAPAFRWSVEFACFGRRIPVKLRCVPLNLLMLLMSVYVRRLL